MPTEHDPSGLLSSPLRETSELTLELLRQPHVIAVQEGDEGSRRLLPPRLPSQLGSSGGRSPDQLDPGVSADSIIERLDRVVRAAVIDHEEPPSVKCLRLDRRDR